jgi:hypothetical protein
MKLELSIVTAVALLAGQVFGKKAGGLRRKAKVRLQLFCHVLPSSLSHSKVFWFT